MGSVGPKGGPHILRIFLAILFIQNKNAPLHVRAISQNLLAGTFPAPAGLLPGFVNPEAEPLDKIQTKVLRIFLLVYSQSLLQLCLRFIFLQTHATSYSICKGESRKT
jgi:hypothetical protein